MCNPAIAALALTAAGTLVQNRSAAKAASKSEALTRAELRRQDDLRKKGYARLDDTRRQFDLPKQEADLDAASDRRETFLSDLLAAGRSEYDMPAGVSAPQVVASETARKIGDALRFGQGQAKSLASLGAWEDLFRGNRDVLRDSATDIGMMTDAARRSAEIHEIEKYNAIPSGGNTFADLLMAGGQALGLYGMTRPAATTVRTGPVFNPAARGPHTFSYSAGG